MKNMNSRLWFDKHKENWNQQLWHTCYRRAGLTIPYDVKNPDKVMEDRRTLAQKIYDEQLQTKN